MKRLLLIITIIVILVGCAALQPNVAGTYNSERNDGTYIELKPDGTFDLFTSEKKHETGTYSVSGSSINLKYRDGFQESFTKEGNTLTTGRNTHFYLAAANSVPTPAPSSKPSSSGSGQLTNAGAQAALDKWMNNRGSVRLKGVQEIPQENAATADLTFNSFRHGDITYDGPGTATFVHYNDGRWMLKTVTLGDLRESTFHPEIEVR